MVLRAEDYGWSSYRARIALDNNDWLDIPPTFEILGVDAQQRIESYRHYVGNLTDARKEADFIGSAVERNQLTGKSKFIDDVQRRTGFRIEFRSRGRPTTERK